MAGYNPIPPRVRNLVVKLHSMLDKEFPVAKEDRKTLDAARVALLNVIAINDDDPLGDRGEPTTLSTPAIMASDL